MQIFNFFVTIIICGLIHLHVESLRAKALSKFPVLQNETFHFQIVPKLENGNLSVSLLDTMVIQVVDTAGLVKEKAIFYYGFHEKFEREFHGSFMKILKWQLNPQLPAIDISIEFQPKSNFYIIEIYHIHPRSKEYLRKSLKDLNLTNRIFRSFINLLSASKLDLRFNSNNRNDFVWDVNDVVTATCRAFDGMPKRIPLFRNIKSLAIINSLYMPEKNERMIQFSIRKQDHLKKIECFVDNIYKSQVIKVKHPPSQIDIRKNDKKEMDCSVKDGYPTPTIKWTLISGPQNASNFYKITSNGTRLFINEKRASNSKWEFECRISQRLGSFVTHMKRNFSIFNQKVQQPCNIDCVNKKVLNLESMSESLQKSLQNVENFQRKNEKNTENFRIKLNKETLRIFSMLQELKQENKIMKQMQKEEISSLKRDLIEVQQKMDENFFNKSEISSIKNQVTEIYEKVENRKVSSNQNQNYTEKLKNLVERFLSSREFPIQKIINQQTSEINNITAVIGEVKRKIKEILNENIGKKFWKGRKGRFMKRQKQIRINDEDDEDYDK